jgi:HSP20 family protein
MFEDLFNSVLGNGLSDDFRRLESQMDELLGRSTWPAAGIRAMQRGTFPPINVGSTPEKMTMYLFAAGLDPKSLDISIQQNLLTVAGNRKLESAENAEYYRQERFDGEFRRVLALPDDVDPEKVDAKYRDGVLQIDVKRREAARPRQINVNTTN